MTNAVKELISGIITDIENNTFNLKYDWTLTGEPPQNYISGHVYRGVNAFILKYYSADTYFLTFLQATEKGIKIKKGEKGQRIIYFKIMKRQDKTDPEKTNQFPFMRFSYVFGLSQTDKEIIQDTSRILPVPQSIIDNYKYCPALFIGDRNPCYVPSQDTLYMPSIDKFNNTESYYSIFFHELAHSTKKHLNRKYNDYAKEELFAEFTASIICNYLNINTKFTEENTKAYLQNWLTNAKQSPKYLMDIMTDAEEAFRLICFNELNEKGTKDNETK